MLNVTEVKAGQIGFDYHERMMKILKAPTQFWPKLMCYDYSGWMDGEGDFIDDYELGKDSYFVAAREIYPDGTESNETQVYVYGGEGVYVDSSYEDLKKAWNAANSATGFKEAQSTLTDLGEFMINYAEARGEAFSQDEQEALKDCLPEFLEPKDFGEFIEEFIQYYQG